MSYLKGQEQCCIWALKTWSWVGARTLWTLKSRMDKLDDTVMNHGLNYSHYSFNLHFYIMIEFK